MSIAWARKGLAAAGLFAVAGGAVAAGEALPQDPVAAWERLAASPDSGRCAAAGVMTLPVDLGEGTALEAGAAAGRVKILYRMNFNQVTEGWNWHPEADSEREDYYRFKYLPLASTLAERGRYRGEDKIGEPQEVQVLWRYTYFFAFANLYDFFPRRVDDDAGFAADIAVPAADAERLAGGDLRMALRGRLAETCLSESTTFWKATYGKPVDYTLKKRYLLGTLDEVWFYDAATQRVLARFTGKAAPAR